MGENSITESDNLFTIPEESKMNVQVKAYNDEDVEEMV